jgi:hypothetical protein
MKKLSSFLTGFFLLVLSLNANAQSQNSSDYFVGKWNVLVEGLPQGDTKMVVNFERKVGKLTGAILDSTQKEISKFSNVEEKENDVTVYFTSQGYDVYMKLEKNGDDKVKGNMMDMFEAKGDRVKEKEPKKS